MILLFIWLISVAFVAAFALGWLSAIAWAAFYGAFASQELVLGVSADDDPGLWQPIVGTVVGTLAGLAAVAAVYYYVGQKVWNGPGFVDLLIVGATFVGSKTVAMILGGLVTLGLRLMSDRRKTEEQPLDVA